MADNLGFNPHAGERIATYESGGVHLIAGAAPPPIEQNLYASEARTADPDPVEILPRGRQRLHVVINVTAVSSTPSVTPSIEAYDSLSDTWYPLLTGAAITATGTTVLKVGPGLAPSSGAAAADFLPGRVRLAMDHADTDSITYTAAAHLGG